MSAIDSRMRNWLIWATPFAVIALLIGWETDWGAALTRVPALDANVTPPGVNVALLPEYKVDGGIEGNRETVDRTLFNPTRRPAPPSLQSAAKSSMQKGQFVLTGTLVVDQKATAFLREVNGGRSRSVHKGETINGILVADVRTDRVRLTQNDDVEELALKVAGGPRTTVQPVTAPPPRQPGQPVVPGQPGGPVGNAVPTATQPAAGSRSPAVANVSDVLASRRRAARAAEAAAQSGQAGAAAPANGTNPAWNEVYQRYMQPRK